MMGDGLAGGNGTLVASEGPAGGNGAERGPWSAWG